MQRVTVLTNLAGLSIKGARLAKNAPQKCVGWRSGTVLVVHGSAGVAAKAVLEADGMAAKAVVEADGVSNRRPVSNMRPQAMGPQALEADSSSRASKAANGDCTFTAKQGAWDCDKSSDCAYDRANMLLGPRKKVKTHRHRHRNASHIYRHRHRNASQCIAYICSIMRLFVVDSRLLFVY